MGYSIVIEGGIFVSHGIWLLRTRKIRAEAQKLGKDFDEMVEVEEKFSGDVEKGRSMSAGEKERDVVSTKDEKGDVEIRVTEVEVEVEEEKQGAEGVEKKNYGTMKERPRPGFVRQDTNFAIQTQR